MARCPRCGKNNNPGAKFCSTCRYQFPKTSTVKPPRRKTSPTHSRGVTPPAPRPARTTPSVKPAATSMVATNLRNFWIKVSNDAKKAFGVVINRIFNPNPQLEGTVINVDAPYDEPPDFDFAKTTLGCIFILPLLPILIAMGIFLSLFRINIMHFFGFLHIFRLGHTPTGKHEPVRNFRVRDASGNEHQVKMKGHLKVGNVSPGDTLTIWGKWKHGTLKFERAFNHRTSSKVLLRKINWAKILGILVLIFIVLSIISYLSKN